MIGQWISEKVLKLIVIFILIATVEGQTIPGAVENNTTRVQPFLLIYNKYFCQFGHLLHFSNLMTYNQFSTFKHI